MRRWAVVGSGVVVLACSFNGSGVSATGVVSGVDASDGGASEASSDTGVTPTPTTGGGLCEPGAVAACPCESGVGEQVCAPDGAGFGPCGCSGGEATSDPTTGEPGTTAVEPGTTTTDDVGTTTVEPGTTTGGDASTTAVDPGTTSGDDTTGGVVCNAADAEPNDDESTAVKATDKKCKQLISQFSGVLAGAADVDWWTYTATWGNGCGAGTPRPSHTLITAPGVRMCVYLACTTDGAAEMFDCGGATDDVSPGGDPGCCSGVGNLAFEFSCEGAEDSARVHVRVDEAPLDACFDYAVTYTYNDN